MNTSLARTARAASLAWLAPLAAGCAAGSAGPATAAEEPTGPTLVVMIVVDQLRADLLERYRPAFTGGLARFLDQGFSFTQATHRHAVTHTAAGHASLSTGVYPSRSGIVANEWRHETGGQWEGMYSFEDDHHPILGYESVEGLGGRSPKNLLRTGLADWVREADSDARTVSVAGKDRAAVPLGGRTTENVYWLLGAAARFVTSTFYARRYPAWLTRFNERVMPDMAADTVWENQTPEPFRRLARADAAPYEGDGVHTTFPHVSAEEGGADGAGLRNAWVFERPPGDEAVLALAEAALRELDLGRRGRVDFLAVSLSVADHVGHAYGPLSQEQLSNLVQLDRALGAFLDHLDREVGRGRWVAALSSDHGALTMPEAARELGDAEAERIDQREMVAGLTRALNDAVRASEAPDQMPARLASLLEERGLVAKAYTHRALTEGEPLDSFAVLYRNSYRPERAPGILSRYGVEVRYGEGDLVHPERTGTSHGSPYWYDRHVPFVLLGAGVRAGSSDRAVYTVDVAPTLAALAGIPVPDDLDGRVVWP